MKILIATEKPFAEKAAKGIQNILEKAGLEVAKLEGYTEKSDLLQAVSDANALIIRSDKIDAEVMDAAPNLKIVVRAGAGYDNVDLAAATERNIVVMNTPGQNANAVVLVYPDREVYLEQDTKEHIAMHIIEHAVLLP